MGRQGGEQHRGFLDPRQFGQPLGLTRVGMASGMPGLFGDRRGSQGLAAALQHQFGGPGEPGKAGGPAGGTGLARRDGFAEGQIEDVQAGWIG